MELFCEKYCEFRYACDRDFSDCQFNKANLPEALSSWLEEEARRRESAWLTLNFKDKKMQLARELAEWRSTKLIQEASEVTT